MALLVASATGRKARRDTLRARQAELSNSKVQNLLQRGRSVSPTRSQQLAHISPRHATSRRSRPGDDGWPQAMRQADSSKSWLGPSEAMPHDDGTEGSDTSDEVHSDDVNRTQSQSPPSPSVMYRPPSWSWTGPSAPECDWRAHPRAPVSEPDVEEAGTAGTDKLKHACPPANANATEDDPSDQRRPKATIAGSIKRSFCRGVRSIKPCLPFLFPKQGQAQHAEHSTSSPEATSMSYDFWASKDVGRGALVGHKQTAGKDSRALANTNQDSLTEFRDSQHVSEPVMVDVVLDNDERWHQVRNQLINVASRRRSLSRERQPTDSSCAPRPAAADSGVAARGALALGARSKVISFKTRTRAVFAEPTGFAKEHDSCLLGRRKTLPRNGARLRMRATPRPPTKIPTNSLVDRPIHAGPVTVTPTSRLGEDEDDSGSEWSQASPESKRPHLSPRAQTPPPVQWLHGPAPPSSTGNSRRGSAMPLSGTSPISSIQSVSTRPSAGVPMISIMGLRRADACHQLTPSSTPRDDLFPLSPCRHYDTRSKERENEAVLYTAHDEQEPSHGGRNVWDAAPKSWIGREAKGMRARMMQNGISRDASYAQGPASGVSLEALDCNVDTRVWDKREVEQRRLESIREFRDQMRVQQTASGRFSAGRRGSMRWRSPQEGGVKGGFYWSSGGEGDGMGAGASEEDEDESEACRKMMKVLGDAPFAQDWLRVEKHRRSLHKKRGGKHKTQTGSHKEERGGHCGEKEKACSSAEGDVEVARRMIREMRARNAAAAARSAQAEENARGVVGSVDTIDAQLQKRRRRRKGKAPFLKSWLRQKELELQSQSCQETHTTGGGGVEVEGGSLVPSTLYNQLLSLVGASVTDGRMARSGRCEESSGEAGMEGEESGREAGVRETASKRSDAFSL